MTRAASGNPLDLRAWLEEARKLGEVKDVRGADWNLELGAISELNVKKESPPALLFDEIPVRRDFRAYCLAVQREPDRALNSTHRRFPLSDK